MSEPGKCGTCGMEQNESGNQVHGDECEFDSPAGAGKTFALNAVSICIFNRAMKVLKDNGSFSIQYSKYKDDYTVTAPREPGGANISVSNKNLDEAIHLVAIKVQEYRDQ